MMFPNFYESVKIIPTIWYSLTRKIVLKSAMHNQLWMADRVQAYGPGRLIFSSRAAFCPHTISMSSGLKPASVISFKYRSGLSRG